MNTVCLLDVSSTGYICGGYASTAWSNSYEDDKKDDNAFLFVIRPIEARKVFHRKRDENGKLLEKNGIWNSVYDGFNFGHDTFYWGDADTNPKTVYIQPEQDFFQYGNANDVVGEEKRVFKKSAWGNKERRGFSDYEVFQLVKL